MNEQNSQANPQKEIGTGEGESPMTQYNPQNITFRTQSSDIKSMQQSGGGRAEAYSLESKLQSATPQQVTPSETFQPPQIPSEAPRVSSFPSSQPTQDVTPQKGSSKKLFIFVIALIVLAGLAFVGYAVVYPVFFEKSPVSSVSTKDVAPKNESNSEPTTSETPAKIAEEPKSLPSEVTSYQSIFTNSVQTIREISLPSLTYEEVMKGFGSDVSALPEFRENIFSRNGSQLSASDFMSTVFPQIFSETTLKALGGFSAFSYVDKNGTWPGFVVQLSSDDPATVFASAFQAEFEKANALSVARLYTKAPGASTLTWKQGQTQEVKNRYLIFGAGDAAVSFNYGWFGETLVLSTSYDGFKQALQYLR